MDQQRSLQADVHQSPDKSSVDRTASSGSTTSSNTLVKVAGSVVFASLCVAAVVGVLVARHVTDHTRGPCVVDPAHRVARCTGVDSLPVAGIPDDLLVLRFETETETAAANNALENLHRENFTRLTRLHTLKKIQAA